MQQQVNSDSPEAGGYYQVKEKKECIPLAINETNRHPLKAVTVEATGTPLSLFFSEVEIRLSFKDLT
ncbi:unnamed protein product [Hermetia illucens]|uniref:Uncharacterized protein n=1 Tax=Hermetia illucens TaxID=343691 RepID=A0A7R8UV66_HERIL|nr:unnamed protein product [Hermetia illucens]